MGVHCYSTSNRNFEDSRDLALRLISAVQPWQRQRIAGAFRRCSANARGPVKEDMEKFTVYTGTTISLMNDNIDTDQILPKQFLKLIDKKALKVSQSLCYLDNLAQFEIL